MTRQFSILQPLLLAFYSRPLYQDVYQHWRPLFSMGYLLLLVAICTLPSVKHELADKQNTIDSFGNAIVEQMPIVTIKDGEMTIDRTVPYIIYTPDREQPLIVFDTSESYEPRADDDTHALITSQDIFLFRPELPRQRVSDVSVLGDSVIDSTQVQGWLDNAQTALVYFIYPFMLMYAFTFRFAQVLIHGFFGLIFARFIQLGITYKQTFCLATVSLTPTVILAAVLAALKVEFNYQEVFYLIIAFAYLAYALCINLSSGKAARKKPVSNNVTY